MAKGKKNNIQARKVHEKTIKELNPITLQPSQIIVQDCQKEQNG